MTTPDPEPTPTDPGSAAQSDAGALMPEPTAESSTGPEAEGSDAAAADPARHAVPRPAPVPPEPWAQPSTSEPAAPIVAPAPVTSVAAAASGPTTTSSPPERVGPPPAAPAAVATAAAESPAPGVTGAPVPTPSSDERAYDFPDPSPPTLPGAGSHVLGALVGLLLGPLAAGLALLGQSRILVVQAPEWDGSVESAGIALVLVGAVLLLVTALLGRWTAAVPITAGSVLTATGLVGLVAPTSTHEQVVAWVSSQEWRPTVEQTVVAATSGTLVLLGVLLLGAGVATIRSRRNGLHVGAFRERHRPPSA